jgi:hypothetical protein
MRETLLPCSFSPVEKWKASEGDTHSFFLYTTIYTISYAFFPHHPMTTGHFRQDAGPVMGEKRSLALISQPAGSLTCKMLDLAALPYKRIGATTAPISLHETCIPSDTLHECSAERRELPQPNTLGSSLVPVANRVTHLAEAGWIALACLFSSVSPSSLLRQSLMRPCGEA